MRYLTVEEILEINARIVNGAHRLRDRSLLGSAVARPRASAFGSDAYPDPVTKVAALLHSLVLNHPFLDGNKRTAVLATIVFLDLNGYNLRWHQDEALHFILGIAQHQITLDEVIRFLKEHTSLHA
jgi:death-on-curing protein